ncbi:MAG: hypothetical protein Q3962_03165, partial [Corynebacterium sp.]|nr:hypothetical protein [Corynebacterium sp.]
PPSGAPGDGQTPPSGAPGEGGGHGGGKMEEQLAQSIATSLNLDENTVKTALEEVMGSNNNSAAASSTAKS